MNFKNILTILFCVFASAFAKAASYDTIRINSVQHTISVGSLMISKDSSITALKAILGTPSKVTPIMEVDRRFVYDELGLSFEAKEDGKTFAAITINYNWDGDKKVASGRYKGVLIIDGQVMNEGMSGKDISANTKIKGLNCIGEMICMTDPKQGGIMVLIGFKDKKVTQFGFGFVR